MPTMLMTMMRFYCRRDRPRLGSANGQARVVDDVEREEAGKKVLRAVFCGNSSASEFFNKRGSTKEVHVPANVGVQPPPQAVGWNHGLAVSRRKGAPTKTDWHIAAT